MSDRLNFLIHRGLAISGVIILIVIYPMGVLIKSSINAGSFYPAVGIGLFFVLFMSGFLMIMSFLQQYYL